MHVNAPGAWEGTHCASLLQTHHSLATAPAMLPAPSPHAPPSPATRARVRCCPRGVIFYFVPSIFFLALSFVCFPTVLANGALRSLSTAQCVRILKHLFWFGFGSFGGGVCGGGPGRRSLRKHNPGYGRGLHQHATSPKH